MSQVLLRPLLSDDIPTLIEVKRRCFPVAWSEIAVRYDFENNPASHWFVAEALSPLPTSPTRRWFRRQEAPKHPMVGFVGFRVQRMVMHITNIGVDVPYRGRGWGEVLLLEALHWAVRLGGRKGTLEVRVSNQPAINLYNKYGYVIQERRRAYYHDNQEDAFWMVVQPLDGRYLLSLAEKRRHLEKHNQWLLSPQMTEGKKA